jgi:hypothetical protein
MTHHSSFAERGTSRCRYEIAKSVSQIDVYHTRPAPDVLRIIIGWLADVTTIVGTAQQTTGRKYMNISNAHTPGRGDIILRAVRVQSHGEAHKERARSTDIHADNIRTQMQT